MAESPSGIPSQRSGSRIPHSSLRASRDVSATDPRRRPSAGHNQAPALSQSHPDFHVISTPSSGRLASPAGSILQAFSQRLSIDVGQTASSAAEPAITPQEKGQTQRGARVTVAVRLRPLNDKEQARGEHEAWSEDGNRNVGVVGRDGVFVPKYRYDLVFGKQSRTSEVFAVVVQPLVSPTLRGISSTCFCYGVTSSGKTYTMMGAGAADPGGEQGLVPLAMQELFSCIALTQAQGGAAAGGGGATAGPGPGGALGLALSSPSSSSSSFSASAASAAVAGFRVTVRLSMMEIYNEVINDLLDPSRTNLKLREDAHRGVVVEGLVEEVVVSAPQAMSHIMRGDAYRKVSSTAYNEGSSRSHTICRFVVECRPPPGLTPSASGCSTPARGVGGQEELDPLPRLGGWGQGGRAGAGATSAVLSLIDLAGSESAKVSVSRGQRMEGSFINKSLLTLGTVISKLAEHSSSSSMPQGAAPGHIPFRDSKLTRLLQNSLTGSGAHVAIVCNITPASSQQEETANTLKFATRAKLVHVTVSANTVVDERALLRRYRMELGELRAQLAAALAAQGPLQPLSPGLTPGTCPDPLPSSPGPLLATSALTSPPSPSTSPTPPAQLARLEAEVSSLRSRLEVEQKLRAQLLSENEALDARLRGLTRLLLPGSGAGAGAGGRGGPGAAAAGTPGLTGSWAGGAGGSGGEGEGHAGRRSPGGRTPRSHRRAEGLGQQRHSCDDPLDLSCEGQDLPVLIRSSTPIAPHHLLPDQELQPDPDQPQQAAQTLVEAASKAYPAGNATTSCQPPGDPTDEEAAEQLLLDQIADLQCDVQGDLTQGGGLGGGYSRSLHSSGTGLLAGSQGSGGAVARASSVRTGASGSLMGDGDKDFEIQVLLADREVLQDQIVGVELSNEALKAERELLLAEVERLKLEHEKERRIVKELESDMMELRNFKNATQAELDALHSQLDCAQRRSPSSSSPSPSTAPPSSLQVPTRSPSLAWAASPPTPFSPLLARSSPSPSHSHSPLLPLSPMATPDQSHPNCPTALETALQLPAGALLQPGSAAQQEGRTGPVAAAGVEAAGWRQLRADVACGAAPAPQLMARLEALEGHVLNAINIALARNRSLEEVVAEQLQQLAVLQAAHQQLLLQNKTLTEQNQQLQGFGVEVLSPGQRSQLVGSITAAARRVTDSVRASRLPPPPT